MDMDWHDRVRALTLGLAIVAGIAAFLQLGIVPAEAQDCSDCFQSCNNDWQECRGEEECPYECWMLLEECLDWCCDTYGEECCTDLQECIPEI